jgi:hypothetical protein
MYLVSRNISYLFSHITAFATRILDSEDNGELALAMLNLPHIASAFIASLPSFQI